MKPPMNVLINCTYKNKRGNINQGTGKLVAAGDELGIFKIEDNGEEPVWFRLIVAYEEVPQ